MDAHHPSSRAGKLKYLSQHTTIEKTTSIYTSKSFHSTPRAQSLIESKKTPGYFPSQKTAKLGKPRFDVEIRGPRTPNSLNMITNFMTESKSQEVRLLKTEVSILKNSLDSITNELHELKESYNKNLLILVEERDSYKQELVNLVKKCWISHEIDQKFKIALKDYLEKNTKLRDLDLEIAFQGFSGQEKNVKLFQIEKTSEPDVGTARFRSLNEEQMVLVLKNVGEAIILEDFFSNDDRWLTVKAGDRVEVIGKADEEAWIVSLNNRVGRVPTKVLLHD
jgi:hypothetical protein